MKHQFESDPLSQIIFYFSSQTFNQFSNITISSIDQHALLKPLTCKQKRLKTKLLLTKEIHIAVSK